YRSLESLRTKSRNKPVLNPDNTTAEPLERFPNDATIEKADAAKKQFEAESKKIMDAAVAMNRHKPLIDNTLPVPKTSSALFDFKFAYKNAVEQSIAQIIKSG